MLAEILNFQGAKPILSMGSLSKIIIPSEIQGIAGLVKSVTEIGTEEKTEE